MKSTFKVQKLELHGRFYINKALQENFNITSGDLVSIYREKDYIVIKKIRKSCMFCNKETDLKDFKGNHICKNCINSIKNEETEKCLFCGKHTDDLNNLFGGYICDKCVKGIVDKLKNEIEQGI